jgi:hypothetical protein
MEPTDIMVFGIWLLGVFANWILITDTFKGYKLSFPDEYITLGIISLTSWIIPTILGIKYVYNRIKS